MLRTLAVTKRVLGDAIGHFNNGDGWWLSSHLALSSLMALFPFLIFATSLASYLGADAFADNAIRLVFDAWPEEIAEPIAREVAAVLTVQRGDLLTLGILMTAFFASNGVEALRAGLNSAYRVQETRSFIWLRVQSLVIVVVATGVLMAVSILLVFAPLAAALAQERLPQFTFSGSSPVWNLALASAGIVLALVAAHLWLPDGKRRFVDIVPGLVFTLVSWVAGSTLFAAYLARFSSYATTYAGLASIMIALFFLYIVSAIFIMGGELNAAIKRYRDARARVPSSTGRRLRIPVIDRPSAASPSRRRWW